MNSGILKQVLGSILSTTSLLLTASCRYQKECIGASVAILYIYKVCCTYTITLYSTVQQHFSTIYVCTCCITTEQVWYSYMYNAYGTYTRLCISTVECTVPLAGAMQHFTKTLELSRCHRHLYYIRRGRQYFPTILQKLEMVTICGTCLEWVGSCNIT